MDRNRFLAVLCALLILGICDVNCRRTRSRSRSRAASQARSGVDQSKQTQADWDFGQDFQQTQEQDEGPRNPTGEELSAPLEFSKPYRHPSAVFQDQEQSVIEQRPNTGDCVIDYEAVSSRHYHPMILRPDNKGFLYPDLVGKKRILRIPSGKRVIASCPGDKNFLKAYQVLRIYVTCRAGSLHDGQRNVLWSQLGCQRKPRPTIERGDRSCGVDASFSPVGWSYSILWPIKRGANIHQIDLCFDERQETVIFTHHSIHGRNINARYIDSDRPSFKKESMFTVSANTVYSKRDQKALFLQLLQDPSHLTGKKQHYLARGHLAADTDFILKAEQDATYYYANAVPQWQAINNGNWKSLENSVRELAQSRRRTLEVWTGVHDTLHLPDANSGKYVELMLGLATKKNVIPVPALLWKVVHDPLTKSAVAIVVVNDVRGQGRGSDPLNDLYDPPCSDICSEIAWVDWNVEDISSGRTFCCSVVDLSITIPNVPKLGRVGILRS